MYGYGYSYPNNPQGSGLMGRYEAGVRSDGGSFAFPIDTGLASRLEGLGLLNASSLVNSCNAGKESVLYNLIPTPVQSLDRFAVTRSTVKWVLGQDGVLTSIPANTPAFEYNTDGTYRGLLVEPAGTNGIRNNTNVGAVAGTPGTLPTNWAENLSGLTRSVVGTGTENGVEYVDIRLNGTASGTSADIRFETATQIVAANGQAWTESAWVKLISAPNPPTQYTLSIQERTAGGSFVAAGVSAITPTSTLVRNSFTRTLSGGGTVERVQPALGFTLVNLATYDFTIRIGLPQMEQSAVATSVVKTSGTSLTRTADSVTLTGASSLIGQQEGTVYAEGFITNFAGATDSIFTISDGTVNNRIEVNKRSPNTIALERVSAIQSGATTISSGALSTGLVRIAIAYKTGDTAIFINGVQAGATSTATFTMPTIGNLVLGANATAGTRFWNSNVRALVLLPTRLPNATLATLTT